MATIIVFAPNINNRLQYVVEWLFTERLQLKYMLTSNVEELESASFSISYGDAEKCNCNIPNKGLVNSTGIKAINPNIGVWNKLPTLFAAKETNCTLPFDLFSALFFLLSRHEEYYHFSPDKHGRYPYNESILYKNNLLKRPIVDEWVFAFREMLVTKFGIDVPPLKYSYQPTYDIDMAYAHLYKGVQRIIGAYLRTLIAGNFKLLTERTKILRKQQIDDYDSFHWLHELHKRIKEKPIWFILSTLKTTAYDKNINPRHPAMVRLVRQMEKEGKIGIHPSYFSNNKNILSKEKSVLEEVAQTKIHISRQHYIKLKIPDTYHTLMLHGITDDYSMGYGSKLGFRAGTSCSFLWYDITKEHVTNLRVHPFCFMDTTAHYEEKLSIKEAFNQLGQLETLVKQNGGCLITIFHNFSLGTAKEWAGWHVAYEHFITKELSINKLYIC